MPICQTIGEHSVLSICIELDLRGESNLIRFEIHMILNYNYRPGQEINGTIESSLFSRTKYILIWIFPLHQSKCNFAS